MCRCVTVTVNVSTHNKLLLTTVEFFSKVFTVNTVITVISQINTGATENSW